MTGVQTCALPIFSEEELASYLQSRAEYASVGREKPALFKRALKDSAGAVGAVLKRLAEPDSQEESCDGTVKALLEKFRDRDQGVFMQQADQMPDSREDMKYFMLRLAEAFRDIFCQKRGVKTSLVFFDSPADAEEYSLIFSEEVLLKRWLFCLHCLEQAEYNLNVKTAKLHFLHGLWEMVC